MQEDKISIIVPVYNVEKYLVTCIASIVGQTYSNLEIILVDDGSTDNSGSVCDEWAIKDDRITVIHKQNGGLSDARNVGLEHSNGKYIVFVDSDDYIDSDLVRYCHNLVEQYEVDMVIYDWHEVGEEWNKTIEDNSKIENEEIKAEDLLEKFVKEKRIQVMACNKFYDRQIWKNLRFPIGKIHEDEYVILDVLMNAKNAIISNRKMYYYRQRVGSITHTRDEKSYGDFLDALKYRCKKLETKQELYNITLCTYLRQLIEFYSMEGYEEKEKVVKTFRKAVKELSIRETYWKTLIWYAIFCFNPEISLALQKVRKMIKNKTK